MAVTLLQFRTDPSTIAAEREAFSRHANAAGVPLRFLDALDATLPWEDPDQLLFNADGILLGGSGDFDFDGGRRKDDPVRHTSRALLQRITPFLDVVFAKDLPTLGVCYGHQVLGAYQGVSVEHDPSYAKTGTHAVRVADFSHPASYGLSEEFFVQYHHKDVVAEVPRGARVIFLGEKCKAAGLAYSDHIVSVQFHPELSDEDLKARLRRRLPVFQNGQTIEDVVRPSPVAPGILTNFFARFSKNG